MNPLFALLRPASWVKNLFVFAPLFFAKDIFDTHKILVVIFSFFSFSLAASFVYILNDYLDRETDRTHEKKKHRPIASGKVSGMEAFVIGAIALLFSVCIATIFAPLTIPYIGVYIVVNILYSIYLKHIAIVDIITVALFYLIRLIVGGVAASVAVSSWIILCTTFVSLFLITGKRIAELNQSINRKVLEQYTGEFLHAILIISSTVSIISYSLYVVLVLNSNYAVYSIFLVMLGIMRYIYVVMTTHKSEYPERVILSDRVILMSAGCWIILMYIVFY